MPIYEYEHIETPCDLGKIFEVKQSMHDPKLTQCPVCAGEVKKIISKTNISTPTTDSELKSKGFAKLVKRDKGVYENVTATDSENRFFHADKPETAPDLSKRIKD